MFSNKENPIITLKDSLMIINYNFNKQNCKKVALFDLDSTLLKFFPKNIEKFEYTFPCVPNTLKNLHSEGYKLIIISNQSLAIENHEIDMIKRKLHNFIIDVDLPFLIFLSIGRNKYRKPCTGIFEYIVNYCQSSFDDIFYVGDAAGPRKNSYTAYTDIKFAYNCNIKFFTSEKYFLGKNDKMSFKLFDITKFSIEDQTKTFEPKYADYIFIYSTKKYSGVTFFIKKYFTKILNPKNIFVNCNDLTFIKNAEDSAVFYLLDYEKDLLTWTKGFFYCSGMYHKKKFSPPKKSILEYLKNKIIRVPFLYDESDFTEDQKKIARLQLC